MTQRGSLSGTSTTRPSSARVPPGAPPWVTTTLIEHTLEIWQPYYKDPLTPEDALAIIVNVGRLFEVLSRGNAS